MFEAHQMQAFAVMSCHTSRAADPSSKLRHVQLRDRQIDMGRAQLCSCCICMVPASAVALYHHQTALTALTVEMPASIWRPARVFGMDETNEERPGNPEISYSGLKPRHTKPRCSQDVLGPLERRVGRD